VLVDPYTQTNPVVCSGFNVLGEFGKADHQSLPSARP
jgi:hypothetical protein